MEWNGARLAPVNGRPMIHFPPAGGVSSELFGEPGDFRSSELELEGLRHAGVSHADEPRGQPRSGFGVLGSFHP